MTKSLLSYLFSFIGFVPINELQQLQQQQQKRITDLQSEESCQYLSSSTFVLPEEAYDGKKKVSSNMQDWLLNISKMTLCQILLSDYPQVADGIYNQHYEEKRYYIEKRQKKNNNDETTLEELKLLQLQVKKVSHELDNLRPSDQFGRASEISNSLYQLLHFVQSTTNSTSSFFSLFGLIILAQESLNCPSEVRQYLFANVKLGRSIILEMSKVLKNFNPFEQGDIVYKWSQLNNNSNWFDTLQFVCTKLARYDITWEYRKEYSEVVDISLKYFKQ